MTMSVLEILSKVRFRIVAGHPAVGQELLELPTAHLGEEPCLSEGEHTATVKRQCELLPQLAFHFPWRELDGIQDFRRDLQFQYRHLVTSTVEYQETVAFVSRPFPDRRRRSAGGSTRTGIRR